MEALFPTWQNDFQNSQVQLRQKGFMSQAEDVSPSLAFDSCPMLHDQIPYPGDLDYHYLMWTKYARNQYGHHNLTYIKIGKTGLHNYIRDEIYRLLSGGGLGLKFESLGWLSDEPARRPVDILIIPSALCRQSSWNFLPWIAIDFIVISPFRAVKGRSVIEEHVALKRRNQGTQARCHEQGIGFEPVSFDHAGV